MTSVISSSSPETRCRSASSSNVTGPADRTPGSRRRRRPVRPRRTASADRSASRDSRPCPRPDTARDRCVIACAVMATMRTCRPVPRSRSRIATVASRPPMTGICRSISTRSKVSRIEPRQRLAAVLGDRHVMAAAGQQAGGDPLVDHVVLDEQDAGAPAFGAHRPGRRPSTCAGRRRGGRRLRADRAFDGGQQIGGVHRLGEVRRDAQLGAARLVAVLAGRAQHHDRGAAPVRAASRFPPRPRSRPSPACSRRAGRARTAGGPARPRSAPRRRRVRSPTTVAVMPQPSDLLGENAPVDVVVVDDQHVEVRRTGSARPEPRGASVDVERDGEMKRAAGARLALDPDPSAHQPHERGRDRQAEAGAAEPARRRSVGLTEGFEDGVVFLRAGCRSRCR